MRRAPRRALRAPFISTARLCRPWWTCTAPDCSRTYEQAGLDGEFSCTGTPPSDIASCQVDVYENATCATAEDVLDADASANNCAISAIF